MDNYLHGIYMYGNHASYINCPNGDWGILVALNSSGGYSIQFAKSVLNDGKLYVRAKSETNAWTPWRFASLT